MTSWYYMDAGQTRGPVDDDAIRVLASAGRLNPASSLMMAGSSEWSTVGAFEAILGLQRTPSGSYAPAGAPPPPPPPATPRLRRATRHRHRAMPRRHPVTARHRPATAGPSTARRYLR